MRKRKSQRRATTFQIVGTFLIVISAFLLVAYVFVDKVRTDIFKYKEQAKEYTVIAARKMPEYTQLASEQAAYNAVYEVGVRGGYNNNSVARVDKINVGYSGVNVSTAVWMDETVRKNVPTTPPPNIILQIPEDRTIERNLTEIIRNATLAYLRIYGPKYDVDIDAYENAVFMVNRSDCISAEYAGMGKGCFNVTIIPQSYVKKDFSSGNLITQAIVAGTTSAHIDIRLFKMYEMMRSFIRNNFLVRTGSNTWNYNLLAKQVEADTACPAGSNCEWDVRSRVTQWCPSQNNCDYSANGLHANLDYSCVPQLVAPACKRTIRDNLKSKIEEIENQINTPELIPYTIKCPSGVPDCEANYNTGRDLHQDPERADSYKTERFNWKIEPAPPNTWNDVIKWDGTSDDYNILWWSQDPATGECELPQGEVFRTDNIATIVAGTSLLSTQTNIDKNTWTKNTGFPSYTQNFPEGTACADAYYVDCHEVKRYKTQTGGGSWWSCCGGGSGSCYTGPDPTAWCEMDGYAGDPAHTATCGNAAPYGGIWCSAAITTVHYGDSHGCSCPCPWTDCPSSYGECHSYTDPGLSHVVETAYTHCDIKYDFYGHFKYRARLDPLLITLTDESKTMPVKDIYGQTKLEKPQLKTTYKGVVYEEPHDDDKCIDREGDEDKTGSRYRHTSDDDNGECPKARNAGAQRTDYYTSSPCNTCVDADNTCYPLDQEVCVGGTRLGGSEYCTRCTATACTDGIQNCGENRTDCGGACTPCPTCPPTGTLSCVAPTSCCGLAEDIIEECAVPALDSLGAACRTDCECQSGLCNTTSKKCANPLAGCPPVSTAPSFEQAITPADGCPLNLSLNFNATSGTQFKIEAIYEKGADKITKEMCRTGVSCGIGKSELPSANPNCNTSFGYANYGGYYPWNCSSAAPVVPSDYQLTKVKISSLDGSDLNLFGLQINASRIQKPTICTSCGGTAYWKNAALVVSGISPGTCADNTAGSTADLLSLINCEATTGKLYGDENGNGQVNMSEIYDCCDGTPPAIKIKKPVAVCGDYTNFSSPCTFQINVTTDKSARCRYSENTEAGYDSMPNLLDSDFVTKREISKSITNAIKTYFIGCSNRIGVKTPLGSACNFTVNCTA